MVRRLRPRNWPVRWRLAAASAGLTLAILILFGAIVGNLASQRIHNDFDHEVEAAVTTLASQVRIVNTISNTLVYKPDLGDFVSPNDATARIFDSQGTLIDRSPGAVDLGPPVVGIRTVDDMSVATVALRSTESGLVAGYVQYGRDESHVDSTIERLWLLIVTGTLGATLLATLAGLAIANRAMRPISALTATARQIADTGDPSGHMPEPKSADEVGELADTLEEMLRSLDAARSEREAALKKQRDFVADASHELRTPLTSIIANLELIQASLDRGGEGEERAMLDSALRSSNRMSRLVADLLLLARADAGRPAARALCDLAEVAGNAAAEVAPTIGERELRIENDRPLPVNGNPDELHRMVLNLLDNAVRHTPPGSVIELRLGTEGHYAVVEVGDDGPGIPPQRRDQIFDRFIRGDGPADTAIGGGSGLGLAIVRAVADFHEGSAEVGASDLGGALFRVRIPLAESRTEPGITPALDRL